MENTPHYDQHCEWVHSILKFYSENEFVFEIKTASIEMVIYLYYEFVSVCGKLE